MNPPLIGLTTSRNKSSPGMPVISVTEAYVQAILRAGGLPVLLPVGLSSPFLASLRGRLQGIIFTGGGDIDPARFHGIQHPRVYDIDHDRDTMEITLVNQAAAEGLPFFGICRGAQMVNVALGGSLYTDIHDQLGGSLRHDWYPDYPRDHPAHAVELVAGSRLADILGSKVVQTNSLHHQGLLDIAPGLKVTAHAPDGLVEAVELPHHTFGLAVQWHPEWLPEDAAMQALFRAFVAAASQVK
jgi:putative glutamine amidotransferase